MSSTADYSERCPWCNSTITRVKFLEIESKIREQEQKRASEAETAVRKRLEEKFRIDLANEKRTLEKKITDAAQKKLETLASERDGALQRLKLAESREAELKKQAQQEFDRKLKALTEERERRHQAELTTQRQLLEKNFDTETLKQGAAFNREREAYQKKLKDMERQLQRKTAQELGDGAEIDIYEALREAFPDDRIKRVPKGTPGADIMHEVMYKGEVCGQIVIDSKNRQGWQYAFVTKLREDQLEAKADHAILSTTVFPSGKKELCIESGVIVVSPARVCEVIGLLRSAMVRMHILGLSKQHRSGKVNALYSYITSEIYAQRMTEARKLTGDILDLDVEEEKEHQKVWKKRGLWATRMKNVLREVDTEIAAILEGAVQDDLKRAS